MWPCLDADEQASPHVLHLHYILAMKDTTIPAVRVEAALRKQLEAALQEGESLSAFVESSVREMVRRRLDQTEFVARGMASLDTAKRSGRTVSAATVVGKLQRRLDKARAATGRKVAVTR